MINIPSLPPLHEAESTYLFIGKDKEPIPLSDLYPTSHDWFNTYTQNKWRGYIFCPLEPLGLQDEIAQCAVSVLKEEFPGLNFNKYAILMANHYN